MIFVDIIYIISFWKGVLDEMGVGLDHISSYPEWPGGHRPVADLTQFCPRRGLPNYDFVYTPEV